MAEFWKAAAIVILAVVLGSAVGKTEKDIAVVLTAVVCSIVAAISLTYLSDVISYLWRLNSELTIRLPMLDPLLKIAGTAMVTELINLISVDAGNASLGKAMQLLGNSVMLYLALPFFETFYTVVQEILRSV